MRPPTFFTRNILHLASILAITLIAGHVPTVDATPCVAFDSDFNLYLMGVGGKDFQLGTQDSWKSTVKPVEITSSGRPPFDGSQTTCYLAQFFNAIYVLDGDKSKPSAVHIFDVAAKSWSTQQVSSGGPDPSSLVAILDHDTNVLYALAGGSVSSLDLGQQKQAKSAPLSWNDVGNPRFDAAGYQPTMALAQNHIHFIGVPNSQPGTANIFVIHFSFFQPTPQSYTASGGSGPFPSTHGQTASFFKTSGVQEEFAFIPDDGSATYVINVENNSTLQLAGPSDKSPSTYAASVNALVQLTSSGSVSFLPYTPGSAAQSKGASWQKISLQGVPAVGNGGSSSGTTTSGGNGTTTSPGSGTGTPSGAGGSGGTSSSKPNGAESVAFKIGITTLVAVGAAAWLLCL